MAEASTRAKYDPASTVTVTERRTPKAGGGEEITTIRTSTVRNRIQVVDEHGQKVVDGEGNPVTYEQDFSMTSDATAPMMKFTIGQGADKKEVASIIKTNVGGEDKYFLKISEAVLANLPEEVKDDIVMVGDQAMLAIDPVEKDGKTIPPVEIDASTGEMKVHIQAKDGGISYTCNFSATGVKIEYDGKTSDYKPKDAAGNRQIIDVEMSTAAFEDMVKTHFGIFRLQQEKELPADQELLNMNQIPYFLIGTYMEAVKDITEEVDNGDGTTSIKEKESGTWSSSISVPDGKGGSQNMDLLVVRLPDPENGGAPRDYYFAKDARGKLYTIDDGKMRPITKGNEGDSEHYYRCYPNAAGEVTRAEFCMKVGSYYRKIGLAIGPDKRNLDPAVEAVINELEDFFPSEPLSRQTDAKHETVSGRDYDAGDSTEIKKLDPTVKGHTIEEEEEKEKDPPPPPPLPKPKKPEFEKKEVKPPKFTQVPGQAAMVAGLFLILASILLGPIGMHSRRGNVCRRRLILR